MTVPGKALRDSVTKLGDVIAANKAVSDELKGRVVAQQVTPVTIQEEPDDELRDSGQGLP